MEEPLQIGFGVKSGVFYESICVGYMFDRSRTWAGHDHRHICALDETDAEETMVRK